MSNSQQAVIRDSLAALCVVSIGFVGIWDATTHNFGVMKNIGPGAFPLIVSIMIVCSGALIFTEGKWGKTAEDPPAGNSPRVIIFVAAGMLSFGFLAQRWGIMPGIIACVTLCSLAENDLKIWQIVTLSLALTGFCALIFIYFLHLPLRLLSW